MQIEPVTQEQLDSLIRAVGPTPAMVARLDDVDLSRGRGVLEGLDRCLWTTDGRRITVSVGAHGTLIVSCAKKPDPEAPEAADG